MKRPSILASLGLALSLSAPSAVGQVVTRASIGDGSQQGINASYYPSISADGRYVAFHSLSSNLVPGDSNDTYDVFVRDRLAGTTTLVSVDSLGHASNGRSDSASMSSDGRFVAFQSHATNLAPGDVNGVWDAYVHDRLTGITVLVSVGPTESAGNGDSWQPSISADGRYVAFWSLATDLVPSDTNGRPDVFVRDLAALVSRRISENLAGIGGNGDSGYPRISADGRYVAYQSSALNLDPSGAPGILLYDSTSGQNVAVSVYPGQTVASYARLPALSADGRFVAFMNGSYPFEWFARDLVAGVTQSVSIGPLGQPLGGNGSGYPNRPAISADGRYVGFSSSIPGGPNDGNGFADIYLRDVQAGTTRLISMTPTGVAGNDCSGPCPEPYGIAISANGASVAFESLASDLALGDSNGLWDIYVNDTGLPPLALTQVASSSGSEQGGDRVQLFGAGFISDSDMTVRFGAAPATVVAVSPTQVSVDTPPGAGTVDVVVLNRFREARLDQAFTFVDPALAVRLGNVNVGRGDRDDVLYVNGSRGDDVGREVHVPVGASIQMVMARPSSRPGDSRFALYVWPGPPRASTLAVLPRGLGVMAFRPPFADGHPIAIWNNAGHAVVLGAPTLPSSPAPSVVFRRTGGAPQPRTVTFQGLIEDDGSQIVEGWSITNAIVLRIQ